MTREEYEKLVQESRQAKEKLDQALKESGSEFLLAALSPIFEAHPAAQAFRFTAYTPYFNDGEPCTYSSGHEWGFVIPVGIEAEGACEDDFEITDDLRQAEKEFQGALSFLDNDQAMTLFGDHCEVTIYRDRVDVEEYCHD